MKQRFVAICGYAVYNTAATECLRYNLGDIVEKLVEELHISKAPWYVVGTMGKERLGLGLVVTTGITPIFSFLSLCEILI